MKKKAFCIAIDIMHADKPPASLAFLTGICESIGIEYDCSSINHEVITNISSDEFTKLYDTLSQTNSSRDVDVNIPNLTNVLHNIINKIKQFGPDVLLVSIFTYVNHLTSEIFLDLVRKEIPDLEIIAGGSGIGTSQTTVGTFGSHLLKKDLIDYYCLGEGDVVLKEFLIGNTDQLGLNSKKTKFESFAPEVPDLDSVYSFPSYKNIDMSGYQNAELKDSNVFPLITSRGCVRDCSFCDVGAFWKKFRFRSGHNIAAEVLHHHLEVGAVHFHIVDSLMNGSLKSFKSFNEEMIKLKAQYPSLANFSYNGMFIIRDKMSHKEELFKVMKEAGCESLQIGIETGSDRLRFEMRKKFTNADIDYHFEMCQKYGIKNTMLTFTGYPTETRAEFEESLYMLERYQKYLIDKTIIAIAHSGGFAILKDTPVYAEMDSIGIEIDSTISHNKINWFNKNNPELTIKERALRDIEFREKALQLRYTVTFPLRYKTFLNALRADLFPDHE